MANRETVVTVRDFIFLGSKIIADGDWNLEIKRCLLRGRKVMTNLDSILKSGDITLPTMVCTVKAMFFPVVMCGCGNWTAKKTERWRIDPSERWCWRRVFRVPWIARRSNQTILKETNPEYSLEGLMPKLKLQYFGHLMWRVNSLKKTLLWERLQAEEKGMTEDKMIGWHHQLNKHEFEQAPRRWWRTRKPGKLQSIGLQRVRHDWVTEHQHWVKRASYRGIYTVWIGYL